MRFMTFKMTKATYWFKGLVVIAVLCLFQVKGVSQSKYSEELFAKGVELYNTGKYTEAIPVFSLCDSLDRAEMDSLDDRKEYARLWLASCYFKSGNDVKGGVTSSAYMLQPIDRRLTVKSDSLISQAQALERSGDLNGALTVYQQAEKEERRVLGNDSYWAAGTWSTISGLLLQIGDTTEAMNYGRAALENALVNRGALAYNTYWHAHKLLELYSQRRLSGFYTDIQSMLARSLEKVAPDMRHDLEMEIAYMDWRMQRDSIFNCRKRMEQAFAECERIHGKASNHYSQMANTLEALLCAEGDYTAALRVNDAVLEHYNSGGSMLHLSYQSTRRDRAFILLGLGNIVDAGKLISDITWTCGKHHGLANKNSVFTSWVSSPFESNVLSSDNHELLDRQAAWLFVHQLPVVPPTDQSLVRGFPQTSPTELNEHMRIILSSQDALLMLGRLSGDSVQKESVEFLRIMAKYVDEDFYKGQLPIVVIEQQQRYQEVAIPKSKQMIDALGKWNTIINNAYSRREDEKPKIASNHALMHAVVMFNDSLAVNALPYYDYYLYCRRRDMAKPLDQLTPKEQSRRRRYLMDDLQFAEPLRELDKLYQQLYMGILNLRNKRVN